MTDRIEKAYYLKEEEVAVLLALRGVERLFGFRMDGGAVMNREELYRILFGLAKQNILSISGDQIQIETDVEFLLEDMTEAESMLLLTGGEEYPECCIYVGRKLVFVQLLGHGSRICRVESVERQEGAAKLRECGWLVPGMLERTQVYRKDEGDCLKAQKLARTLYDKEKDAVLQEEIVQCCLIQYALPQGRKTRQLLIINDVLDDYLALSDEKQDSVYLYSDEKSEELLRQMVGGML